MKITIDTLGYQETGPDYMPALSIMPEAKPSNYDSELARRTCRLIDDKYSERLHGRIVKLKAIDVAFVWQRGAYGGNDYSFFPNFTVLLREAGEETRLSLTCIHLIPSTEKNASARNIATCARQVANMICEALYERAHDPLDAPTRRELKKLYEARMIFNL